MDVPERRSCRPITSAVRVLGRDSTSLITRRPIARVRRLNSFSSIYKPFWILDFGFWIGTTGGSLKSKIQNPKSKILSSAPNPLAVKKGLIRLDPRRTGRQRSLLPFPVGRFELYDPSLAVRVGVQALCVL